MTRTKTYLSLLIALTATCLFGQRFDKVKFNQTINTQALDAVNKSIVEMGATTGMVIKSDNELRLYTTEGEDVDASKVFINDVPLPKIVGRIVQEKLNKVRFQNITMDVPESEIHSENPLWGKKMAVVGDSEARGTGNYASLIGARNNMIVVNNAIGGSALVGPAGHETALFPNYQNWIPQDSDYIVVHIGCNDGSTWDASDADDSTDTTKFKGAWNVFLQNLKSEYPNAKKAIIMPYYWNTSGGRDARVAWMKTRCDKYELEYIDAVEELDYDSTTRPQYFQTEGDPPTVSWVHFSPLGHQRVSYLYENFLKTRVQFSK